MEETNLIILPAVNIRRKTKQLCQLNQLKSKNVVYLRLLTGLLQKREPKNKCHQLKDDAG